LGPQALTYTVMTGQQTANQDITTNYWESLHIA